MSALDSHHALLRLLWAEEAEALECRRRHLLAAAAEGAEALKQQGPQRQAVWLFGSAATPQGFRRHSHLDLALAGLPAAGETGIAIDRVRLEDLAPPWQGRIRQRAQRLL